jgi:hypothetical protein
MICDRKQESLLPGKPELRIVVAAGRTIPVPAGMIRETLLLAYRTAHAMAAKGRSTARLDRTHGTQLILRHAGGKAGLVPGSMTADNFRQ